MMSRSRDEAEVVEEAEEEEEEEVDETAGGPVPLMTPSRRVPPTPDPS